MAVFFFHRFGLNRYQNMGRRLRAMRVRLAKKRRAIRRMRQSLSASQIAAEQIERDHERMFAAEQIERRNRRIIAENALIDQLVYDLLAELENDPLIRSAAEAIRAENLDGRNIIINQAPPPGGGRPRRRR
ncbi:hypothetical protein QUC31_009867 [Theobroma cacao]|nr:hypothetical protein QQP08_015763 [Theobroma cacao]